MEILDSSQDETQVILEKTKNTNVKEIENIDLEETVNASSENGDDKFDRGVPSVPKQRSLSNVIFFRPYSIFFLS